MHRIQIRQIYPFILLRRLIENIIRECILITKVHPYIFRVLEVLTENFVEVEHEILQLFSIENHQTDAVVELLLLRAGFYYVDSCEALDDLFGLE